MSVPKKTGQPEVVIHPFEMGSSLYAKHIG